MVMTAISKPQKIRISQGRKKVKNSRRRDRNRGIIYQISRKTKIRKKISNMRMAMGLELNHSWSSHKPSKIEKYSKALLTYSNEAKPPKTIK